MSSRSFLKFRIKYFSAIHNNHFSLLNMCEDTQHLSPNHALIVSWVTLISAIASLFGSSMMIIACMLFSKGKGISRLVVFLAIADFGWALIEIVAFSIIIHDPLAYTVPLCTVFRLLFQLFSGAAVFWR